VRSVEQSTQLSFAETFPLPSNVIAKQKYGQPPRAFPIFLARTSAMLKLKSLSTVLTATNRQRSTCFLMRGMMNASLDLKKSTDGQRCQGQDTEMRPVEIRVTSLLGRGVVHPTSLWGIGGIGGIGIHVQNFASKEWQGGTDGHQDCLGHSSGPYADDDVDHGHQIREMKEWKGQQK